VDSAPGREDGRRDVLFWSFFGFNVFQMARLGLGFFAQPDALMRARLGREVP
jgi:hypothetical protein